MKRLAWIAFLAFGAAPAMAQDAVANNTAFGNWLVTCRAISTDQTECRLVQSLTRTADQSLVVRMIAAPREDGGAVLFAQVPLGVYLGAQPGMDEVGATDGVSRPFVWQRCVKEVCEAARVLSAQEIADMTAAGKILFGYKPTANDDPLIVQIDTSQFAAGIDAIR